eukprot:338901-Pelagomonas_calceolata.AAC.4
MMQSALLEACLPEIMLQRLLGPRGDSAAATECIKDTYILQISYTHLLQHELVYVLHTDRHVCDAGGQEVMNAVAQVVISLAVRMKYRGGFSLGRKKPSVMR